MVGANGAGKSSLLGILSGEIVPDAGTMVMDGEGYAPTSVAEALAAGVGYIPQEIHIESAKTVAEAIFRTSFRSTLPRGEQISEAAAIIERYGVALHPEDLLSELSPAEHASVELLRMACEETQLILLDEVTARFDDHEISLFHALAQELTTSGRSIVHVSHRLDEIISLADRIVVLREGRIHNQLVPRDTDQSEVFTQIFNETRRSQHRPADPDLGEERISLKDVCLKNRAEDITFSVRAGEIFGITGLRRSGINEVASILTGMLKFDSGEMRVNGEPVRFESADDAFAHRIAYIPERNVDRDIDADDSIGEVLGTDTDIEDESFSEEVQRLQEVLAKIRSYGIRTSSLRRKVGELSHGDLQKTAVAKTLSQSADSFVLHQPTRGVDARAKQDIYDLLRELAESGCAVVLVSSDMTELITQCNRVAILRDKHLIDVFSNEELTEDTIMMLALGYDWFDESEPA